MKASRKICIIGLLLLTFISSVYGQRRNPVRIELNANLDMEDYQLVPCRENGVLVFFESDQEGSSPDTYIWNFAFYNNQMQQQWLADTALIAGLKFKAYASDEEHTYLLFLDTDRIRSEFNAQILKVDYDQNSFEVISLLVPDKTEPIYFSVENGNAFLALNNKDFKPDFMLIDLSSGKVKRQETQKDGLNIIQSVYPADEGNDKYVVMGNYIGKKQNSIIILHLDAEAMLKNSFTIDPASDTRVLNEARIARAAGDTVIVMGTYHNFASRVGDSRNDEGPESAGYFTSMHCKGKQTYIHYYNFLEFEEMYRALSSKTLADLRRKAEKQKSKGKEYSMNYTLLLHDIIPMDGNYIILSEAYYPEYRTVTDMYYDYYGRPIPQTYTVFDGYKYFTGIAAGISPEGDLIWDNGIEIKNLLTFSLNKYLGHFTSADELALFYSNENKLYYKMLGTDDESRLQNLDLAPKYKGDKLMEDLGSKMIHWYGNFFICYGYQKIRNNRLKESKRTIFYFSKIAFN